jgi:ABC-type Fe3+ transport system permease subunit
LMFSTGFVASGAGICESFGTCTNGDRLTEKIALGFLAIGILVIAYAIIRSAHSRLPKRRFWHGIIAFFLIVELAVAIQLIRMHHQDIRKQRYEACLSLNNAEETGNGASCLDNYLYH